MNAVEVRGLSYAYPARDGARQVLRELSFSVRRGEIFGLLGPNGSGKTTTFRVLSTFLRPPPGAVRVLGHDAAAEPDAVRRAIGVVFQSPSLDKRLTVAENLRCQGRLYGLGGAELESRIGLELGRMGLKDRARDLVLELSGGLARRAEVAKSLLHRPDLLLLDEPSTGLDPVARRELWEGLRSLKEGGATVLLTTHWMEEAERCDRLAVLDRGRVVAEGTPEELKSSVGGDVLSLEADDPRALARDLRSRLGLEAAVIDGTLRLERPEGHKLIPQIAEAFPGRLRSIRVGKPTLEDVFVRSTGHRFARGEEER